jgi:hypothetical protein
MKLSSSNTNAGAITGFEIEDQGPTGTVVGRLIDIKDDFQVEVKNWEGDGTSLKDVTRFLFSYKADNKVWLVQSWQMTQSPSEKSALFKMLRDMKGEAPVFDGQYDYLDEVGQTCQITVGSKTSKLGRNYNYVSSVAPLLEGLEDQAPALDEVEIPGGRNVPIDPEDTLFKA